MKKSDKKEKITVKGTLVIEEVDPKTKKVIRRRKGKNLITTLGREAVIRLLTNTDSNAKPGYIAGGSGTSAPQASDTSLENEIFRRAISSVSNPTPTSVQYVVELGSDEYKGTTFSESGLFTSEPSDSDRKLFARRVFSPFIKGENILRWKWTIQV